MIIASISLIEIIKVDPSIILNLKTAYSFAMFSTRVRGKLQAQNCRSLTGFP